MSHIQDVLRGLYFRKSRQESLFHALDRIEAAQRELGRGIDRIDSAQEAAGQTIDQIKERLLRFEVVLSRIAGRSTPDSKSLSSQNKRIMYSQFGEDMLVEHLFPTLANGRYLDVGCYHPYKFSNTAKLYARGWSGVNIDANPKTINLFKAERPSDINLNVIVGNGPIEEAAFYILDDDSPSNTLSVQFAEAQAQNMNKKLPDPIMVKKVTLSESSETLSVQPSDAEAALYRHIAERVRTEGRQTGPGRSMALRTVLRLAGSSPKTVAPTLDRLGWSDLAEVARQSPRVPRHRPSGPWCGDTSPWVKR